MDERKGLLEVMARGIWDEPGPDGDHIAVYFTENFRNDAATKEENHKWAFMVARMAAKAALTALEADGWVVARKVPGVSHPLERYRGERE